MRASLLSLLSVCVWAGWASVAGAQILDPNGAPNLDPRCINPTFVGVGDVGGDACQKVIDVYDYMNGQLGTLVAGGNATLGQVGSLGGFGTFSIGIRANAMSTSIPNLEQTGIGVGPPGSPALISTSNRFIAVPTADAAFGLFKGFPAGVTHIGGVDLLLGATALPHFTQHAVQVTTPDHWYSFGVGSRVGLLEESLLTPGVSITYFRRDLPHTRIVATAGPTRSLTVEDYHLTTTAWRLVVGKSFLLLSAAAGIGRDKYDGSATLTYNVDGNTPSEPFVLDATPTRTNAFLDLALNLAVLKIAGEIGRVWSGGVTTYNTFDQASDAPRWYGSLGLRIGR
ncbi:MAG TPA: hypothetical protein VFW98_14550 [Gemmatimonadaceae bacterium]|nr:hypothetical protein [Gemmatimonadaceae bacterium]